MLSKYFDISNLQIAWERCKRDRNSDTKDYAGLALFEISLQHNLHSLSKILLAGNFKPTRPAKFYEPKPSGTQRTKTILCIQDAIVYQCIIDFIASESYEDFQQYESFVFGSVLHSEVAKGAKLLNETNPEFYFFELWMSKWNSFADSINSEIDDRDVAFKLETDITGFFDCIPHSLLLQLIHKKYKIDKGVLDLLNECLNVWSGTSDSTTPGVGIPQGPQCSFFLANLYLSQIDEVIVNKGLSYYRYMDDIRIFSSNKLELIEILVELDKHLKSSGLSINSKKTLIEELGNSRENEKIDVFDLSLYFGLDEESEKEIAATQEVDNIDLAELFGSNSESNYEGKKDFEFSSKEDASKYLENELDQLDLLIQSKIP